MSDRLAVMEGGRIAQVGTPEQVYDEPADAYVADFLGVSNLMDAQVTGSSAGTCRLRLGEFDLEASCGATDAVGAVRLAIRPERVCVEAFESAGPNRVPAMVERIVFMGSSTQVILRLAPGARVQALIQNTGTAAVWGQGTPVQAFLPAEALRVLADHSAVAVEDPVELDTLDAVALPARSGATSGPTERSA